MRDADKAIPFCDDIGKLLMDGGFEGARDIWQPNLIVEADVLAEPDLADVGVNAPGSEFVPEPDRQLAIGIEVINAPAVNEDKGQVSHERGFIAPNYTNTTQCFTVKTPFFMLRLLSRLTSK